MRIQWLSERAREIVSDTLRDEDADVERVLVLDALVVREGDHYRIETGGESWNELEALARELAGECDCGATLSLRDRERYCRRCESRARRH